MNQFSATRKENLTPGCLVSVPRWSLLFAFLSYLGSLLLPSVVRSLAAPRTSVQLTTVYFFFLLTIIPSISLHFGASTPSWISPTPKDSVSRCPNLKLEYPRPDIAGDFWATSKRTRKALPAEFRLFSLPLGGKPTSGQPFGAAKPKHATSAPWPQEPSTPLKLNSHHCRSLCSPCPRSQLSLQPLSGSCPQARPQARWTPTCSGCNTPWPGPLPRHSAHRSSSPHLASTGTPPASGFGSPRRASPPRRPPPPAAAT